MHKLNALLSGLLLLAFSATAQVSTARLEGTVQDSTGGLIPGAKVEVVNVKTQTRAETASDAQGRYIFQSLPAGEYTLTVEAGGFRKAVRQALVLTVADTMVETVKLEVGSVSESVVVEANAVRVQTADSQVGRAITLRDIDVLPQLGRDPIILSIFNPGVQIDVGSGTSYSRVNGTRQGSNNATLDGVAVNDPMAPRLGLSMTPTTSDTVEEFRIITNGGKAEYGRNAGAQVQMITRSGTNQFHGGAWDYLRNTKLNANNFFNNSSRQSRPTYIRNLFGGKFEGPIKKDRTFFFGAYDGNRTRQQVVRTRTVLTPEAKQGLFRWRLNNGPVQSFNVVANDPRRKGVDPEVKKLLDKLPDPNTFDVGDGLNTAGFRFNAPANSYNDQFTVKVDHQLWSGNRIFFRHSWMRTASIDTTNSAEARFPGAGNGTQGGNRKGWAFGSDWTVTSRMVNEFRFGGQRTNTDFLKARPKEAMIAPNLYTNPIAEAGTYSQGRTLPYKEITDNISTIRGKHTIKTGVNIRLTDQHTWREDYAWPVVSVSRSFGNAAPDSIGPFGNSVISASDRVRFQDYYNDILGRISSVRVRFYSDLEKYQPAGTGRDRDFKYREVSLFVQDDWRVNRKLVLNLGLRYEFFGPPFEVNGLQGYLDRNAQLSAGNKLTDLVVKKGGPYFNQDWNNFAPRVGFAWDLAGDGRTAIRGQWGMFYDRMVNATLTSADSIPGFSTDQYVYPNENNTDRRAGDGLPAMPVPSSVLLTLPQDRATSILAMNPNLRTGYTLHAGLNIQREIFRNTVLEAGYVGTRGVKLFMHNNINQLRIYEDFLGAFKQLQAFRTSGTPVPANNTLVRIFGTPAAAITAINGTTLDTGSAGLAANNLDTNAANYNRYAAAGLPATYLRSYPQFVTLYQGTNDGRSYYDSLQVSLRRQMGALKVMANYTWSKSLDNWNSEGNGTDNTSVIDWRNLRLNRSRTDFDIPHSLNATYIYTLPVGKGRRYLSAAPRWVDSILGGWDIGLLQIWQSGATFSVSSGRATGPNHGSNSFADFPGDRNIGALDKRDGVVWFTADEKAKFTVPEAGAIGTSGRNAFRGPRYFNMDATLSKSFRLVERHVVRFRAEAYNMFNNVNFGSPAASVATQQTLGRFSGTVGGARIVQMALRYEF